MRRMLDVTLLLCLMSGALAQVKPTATISFDNDLNGVGAAGVVAGTPEGAPTLAPGKVGQALKSGPGSGYVRYPTTGLLRPKGGTVEMWVCPLDWRPAENEFHVFFDTRGQGALYLYKFHDSVRLMMLSCDNVAGPYAVSSTELDWEPGQWHHIAGTWSAQGVMAYVDGKPAAAVPTPCKLPQSLGSEVTIGDNPWHLPRSSSSLIDEVRLYDRPLSPAHIAAHFEGRFDVMVPLTAEGTILSYSMDPAAGELRVQVNTSGADVPDESLTARVAMVAPGQPLPADAASARFAGGQAEAVLPLGSRRPGDYEVVAQVQQDGAEVFELRKPAAVPDTLSWMGSRLGLADRVLPPWTPVQVKGSVVSVWGRNYAFDRGPLPNRISSAGERLLAAPIAIRAGSAGADGQLVESVVSAPTRGSDTRCEVTGSWRYGLNGAQVEVRGITSIEYDGMLWCELTVDRPETLDRLTIDIPLRSERALYRHRYAYTWDSSRVTGNLPSGEGVVDQEKFIPYYWLGDNDRGLFWFCESDEMWPNGQQTDAVQVIRSGGRVTLRLNILAPGQKLPANWKLGFGLQATPVKPLPKDWRKWRLQPGRNATVSIIWPTPEPDSLRWYGYPEATDPALFRQRVAGLHRDGVKAVPYLCLSFLSAACPEWPYFGKYWAMGPVDTGSADVAQYGAGFAMVSPLGQGYSDFIVTKTADFIRRYGVDGVYHDNTHPYSSASAAAGLGYERDGQRYPTFPIRAYRDLYRRMYAVIKSRPSPTFIMAHMSGKVTIPILAYEDSYLDGEHFRGVVKDSYLDLMSLDTFRAEYMGRQWGIMPFFLPEFDQERARQVEPTRGLMALLMLHDTAVWPIWCNADVVNEALAALDSFGYVDSDFVGYFAAQPPAATDMADVHVSAYRKLGKALLVVGNVGRESREGTVTINPAGLGFAPRRAVLWPGKQPLALADGKAKLTVPGLGYQMVVVQ
ncbi:MAG: LamG domain-containing protein [Armatimonadetes bacterium]|nr:LamG domain-containing protein [Armatimonadota bacterium]